MNLILNSEELQRNDIYTIIEKLSFFPFEFFHKKLLFFILTIFLNRQKTCIVIIIIIIIILVKEMNCRIFVRCRWRRCQGNEQWFMITILTTNTKRFIMCMCVHMAYIIGLIFWLKKSYTSFSFIIIIIIV